MTLGELGQGVGHVAGRAWELVLGINVLWPLGLVAFLLVAFVSLFVCATVSEWRDTGVRPEPLRQLLGLVAQLAGFAAVMTWIGWLSGGWL